MKALIIGAGNKKIRKIPIPTEEEIEITSLDIDPNSNPDVLWDLNIRPLPFPDNSFDEIHAYEVLEHLGQQGDWKGFFDEWNEYYRILKPNGVFCISCPKVESPWLWGDPGHTRVITKETLTFLDRDMYKNVGNNAMTDYRFVYNGHFKLADMADANEHVTAFILEKLEWQ